MIRNNKINAYNQMYNIPTPSFRNEDYTIKLSNQPNLKFFKDELTIKYSGKGYNTIDYSVRKIFLYFRQLNQINQSTGTVQYFILRLKSSMKETKGKARLRLSLGTSPLVSRTRSLS